MIQPLIILVSAWRHIFLWEPNCVGMGSAYYISSYQRVVLFRDTKRRNFQRVRFKHLF